jgi:hypothetical protein
LRGSTHKNFRAVENDRERWKSWRKRVELSKLSIPDTEPLASLAGYSQMPLPSTTSQRIDLQRTCTAED